MDSSPNGGNLRYHLICVDDDQEFLRSLQMMLSSGKLEDGNGFELESHFIGDPQECFTLIHELIQEHEEIALIISDQKMPRMTGVEFLEGVSQLAPQAMRILLTGYASLDSAKYAINKRLLDQYISKPIEDYDWFLNNIVNALKTFYFKKEKEHADRKLKEQMKALERANNSLRKANDKIKNMQQAAEKIAYLAQGFKKLDMDEVLDLIITRIPPIFHAQFASLFLFDRQSNILKLARTNFLKMDVQQPLEPKKMTPMTIALKQNKIIVVSNIKRAPFEFLNQEDRGHSCIVIPFVVSTQYSSLPLETEGMLKDLEGIKGVLNLSNIPHMESHDIVQYKASLIKDILGINIWNAQLYQQTQKLAITDSLTGLYNKHIFIEFLKKECERSRRSGSVFFLAIGDADNFKAINDTYGHLVGDEVLKELGAILQENIRKYDIIARFGGEEFAFVLRESSGNEAFSTLDRLRRVISEKEFTKAIRLTMSFGLCGGCVNGDCNYLNLLECADAALYRAKSQGKNRIELVKQ